jgi:hypothetical protein
MIGTTPKHAAAKNDEYIFKLAAARQFCLIAVNAGLLEGAFQSCRVARRRKS